VLAVVREMGLQDLIIAHQQQKYRSWTGILLYFAAHIEKKL
jgi:hypothetical protein